MKKYIAALLVACLLALVVVLPVSADPGTGTMPPGAPPIPIIPIAMVVDMPIAL